MAREDLGSNVEQSLIARVVSGVRTDLKTIGTWFTPGQPLRPMAQEEAKNRAFDFPVGFNLHTRPRTQSGEVGFNTLRGFAEGYDLLRLVIETRKDQIEAYEWEVVDENPEAGDNQAEIKRLSEFLEQPSFDYDWPTWIRALSDDMLVIDAVSIYPRLNRGGQLISLDLMDGATIKRVLDEQGRTPMAPDPAYQQILKGLPAVNYSVDELVYWMRNPRTYRVYGCSPVEQIMMTVNIALRRQVSQLQYYTEGNVPEALAGVPDGWTPEQIAQFQIWWDGLMEGDTASRRHMKFLPVDASKVQMIRQPELKDMYDEWLARIVCFAFSISPQPFVKDNNRSVAETVAKAAKEEGIVPTLIFLERRINRLLAKYAGALPGIKFRFKMNNTLDPKVQAEIDDLYIRNGTISVDEVRPTLGKDKIGVGNMVYGDNAVPIELYAKQKELPSTGGTPPIAEDPVENPSAEQVESA